MTMSKACFDCPRNLTDCFRPHCITGDGVERALLSVNRQLSGPGIHVCEGDTVIAEVHNFMEMGEGTSVHWHGMHQVRSVPGRDALLALALRSAAQRGHLRPAGGPAGRDPHAGLYDTDQPEHTLLLSDWFHELGATKFAAHHYSNGDNKPKGLIINGRGAFATKLRQRTPKLRRTSPSSHGSPPFADRRAQWCRSRSDSLDSYTTASSFDFVLTADVDRPGNLPAGVAGLADCDSASPWQFAWGRYQGFAQFLV
uniref:Plastocyanin-like domain-containing protein n=1 Tax=Macrostomum lignano TaxID=282301 RepID=A0A1I8GJY6_9PLAT